MQTAMRVVLLAVALLVAQAVLGSALLANAEGAEASLPLVLLSNLLAACVYVRLAQRSPGRGGALLLLLLAVAFGLPALNLAEAALFDIGLPRDQLLPLYGFSFLVAVAAALAAAALVGKLRGPGEQPLASVPLTPLRLLACALAYVAFYFAAGMLAWPFLRPFYELRAQPPESLVALVQVFRGAALATIAWGIARHETGGRSAAALSAALALSIVGGVAPLLLPNPYLPEAIRHVHLVEVGVSNFLFGVAAIRLLRPAP